MFVNKLAILAGVEAVYGTDVVPTAAMQVSDVTFTPLAGSQEPRNIVRPFMGAQGFDLVGIYQQLAFSIEFGGAGADGTAPAYGPLLRGCGFSETVTAATSVEYSPVSSGFEGNSIYYYLDGTRYVMLGSRGKVEIEFSAQKKPLLKFTMSGLLGTFTDTALPATDLTAFIEPPVVSKAATQFSLDALAAPMESLTIDGGQQINPRLIVNLEEIAHTDRQMTGSVVIDQVLKATKDWRSIALDKKGVALAVTHGTEAGNIVQLAAPNIQVGQLTHGNSQGVANNTLPLTFRPDEGNDELVITIK